MFHSSLKPLNKKSVLCKRVELLLKKRNIQRERQVARDNDKTRKIENKREKEKIHEKKTNEKFLKVQITNTQTKLPMTGQYR